MTGLVDPRGNPLAVSDLASPRPAQHRRVAAAPTVVEPRIGKEFGQWAGREGEMVWLTLPGGASLQFDLTKLTLGDFRSMRQHYQLGASLNVLMFVQHQMEWSIECESVEIADMIENNLRAIWTPFIRAMAQSFWAGFSPNAINYENARSGYVEITKVKDLIPEECRVKWREVEGWKPYGRKIGPKIKKYDGFYQGAFEVPTENSLWYPLLMENGDYYGRKLLKPAFPSWFFSNLIHLFANRFFERYGEPLPIGRAPLDEEIPWDNGTYISAKSAMTQILQNIRSRSVAVLPSDRDPDTKEYLYDISYLESQMRGADFERYMSRLDEEMSLSLFTPVLLFRTADVGSYNLGQAHLRIFQQYQNAIAGDWQSYIQNYIVDRLRVINFGHDSPPAQWVYRKQGQADVDMYKELMVELVRQGVAKPNYDQLGSIVGLDFEEIEQLVEPPDVPGATEDEDPNDPKANERKPVPKKADTKAAKEVARQAIDRVAREFSAGQRNLSLGFRRHFERAAVDGGMSTPEAREFANEVYGQMNTWLDDIGPAIDRADDLRSMGHRLVDQIR
jgi:uncharacterized protein DUF935